MVSGGNREDIRRRDKKIGRKQRQRSLLGSRPTYSLASTLQKLKH